MLVGNLKERGHIKDHWTDGTIILKYSICIEYEAGDLIILLRIGEDRILWTWQMNSRNVLTTLVTTRFSRKILIHRTSYLGIPSGILHDSEWSWTQLLSLARRKDGYQRRFPYRVPYSIPLHPTCSQSFDSSQFLYTAQKPADSYATVCLHGESIHNRLDSEQGVCTSRHSRLAPHATLDFQSAHLWYMSQMLERSTPEHEYLWTRATISIAHDPEPNNCLMTCQPTKTN